MELKKLFYKILDLPISLENINIKNISINSRNIIKDDLFVAYEGIQIDSHNFIEEAVEKGAVIVIGTANIDSIKFKNNNTINKIDSYCVWEICINNLHVFYYIKVANSRSTLALLSSNWFGRPSDRLKFIGITGTDGKTTTSNMVYSILKQAGYKVDILSTINSPGLHVTTPDPFTLHKIFADFVMKSIEWVILETSSHSLAYNFVYGIEYEISGLTNITPEHLDFHKTMQNYINAKSKLFLQSKISVLPQNDIGQEINNFIKLFELSTNLLFDDGQTDNNNFKNNSFIPKTHHIDFYSSSRLNSNIHLQLPGQYNIENAALASTIAYELNISNNDIKQGLESVTGLNGRWEILYKSNSVIIVDFAHTSNALHEVLTNAKEYMKKNELNGRLIHIFGCAGERDSNKRIYMGMESGKFSDITILTSEDPRCESLKYINVQIKDGLEKSGMKKSMTFENANNEKKYYEIDWRGSAISFVIKKLIRNGDLLIITGKGHEQSLSFQNEEYAWSDQKAVYENIALIK